MQACHLCPHTDSMPKSPANGSLYSNELGHEGSSLRPHSDPEDDLETDWDAEFEDYVGISAPLYQVVEGVFNIPAQKFFRRQVSCCCYSWREIPVLHENVCQPCVQRASCC